MALATKRWVERRIGPPELKHPRRLDPPMPEIYYRFLPTPHAGSSVSVDIAEGSWIGIDYSNADFAAEEQTASAEDVGSESLPYIWARRNSLTGAITITAFNIVPSINEQMYDRLLCKLEYSSGTLVRIIRAQFGDIVDWLASLQDGGDHWLHSNVPPTVATDSIITDVDFTNEKIKRRLIYFNDGRIGLGKKSAWV